MLWKKVGFRGGINERKIYFHKSGQEERPDIDQVYMNAIQLITGSGGWSSS